MLAYFFNKNTGVNKIGYFYLIKNDATKLFCNYCRKNIISLKADTNKRI